jgi:hypothetical protein
LTTTVSPLRSTNNARINSAAFPNVTFKRPPIEGPAIIAICSVLRRIQTASGTMARIEDRNTQIGPKLKKYARISEAGTNTSMMVKNIFSPFSFS